MTKYIKGKDGKFAGSIGDGKTNVPTPAPATVSKAEQKRQETNARIREINARFEAGKEARQLAAQKNAAGRQAWFSISDTFNESYPAASWMNLDDEFNITGLTDHDGNIIATAADISSAHPDVAARLKDLREYDQVASGRYAKDGGHRLGIFSKCGEDGCEHLYYPEGFQPGHTASRYCRSGRRNHCTCDLCF